MARKINRPSKTSPFADLIAGIIIGTVGVALIVIGASTWHPMIIVGAILVIIALFLANIWP